VAFARADAPTNDLAVVQATASATVWAHRDGLGQRGVAELPANRRNEAPCHALEGRVGDHGSKNQRYDVAPSSVVLATMVIGPRRRRTKG
jgi:hypothetical protein